MGGDEMVQPSGSSPFADGAVVGIGSLPHSDPAAASAFAIGEFDVATMPTLPKLGETMLAQAAAAMDGVELAADGGFVVDRRRLGVAAAGPRLDADVFAALHAWLDLAGKVRLDGGPVKWQTVGPVTLGLALEQSGVDRSDAFVLAADVVRAMGASLADAITAALPRSPQMMLLDEPSLIHLMDPAFPIPPDEAIDHMSTAMAALPSTVMAGVHCCGACDVATLLASGPAVVSLPASESLVDWAGYVTRFLDDGGVIVWGVVDTGGPVPATAERPWRELSDLWCGLVQLGCDPVRLRRQSLVSPQCGLTAFSVSVARRIVRLTADVGKRVRDQSSATRLALGA
jgi:methionine synthase II (cobalamin-independent)